MKIRDDTPPKSSFLSVEKDLSLLANLFLKNTRLKKLLHYTTRDALLKPDLTSEESYALIGKHIKIVPKLEIDGEVLAYVIIGFDNFTPNASNPEFRDHIISFDIICHFDQWQLQDFQLRPYRIAAEIDAMINGKHLTGIGKVNFLGANQLILNDELAGISLMYQAIHGEEDQRKPLNPNDDLYFDPDFSSLLD